MGEGVKGGGRKKGGGRRGGRKGGGSRWNETWVVGKEGRGRRVGRSRRADIVWKEGGGGRRGVKKVAVDQRKHEVDQVVIKNK